MSLWNGIFCPITDWTGVRRFCPFSLPKTAEANGTPDLSGTRSSKMLLLRESKIVIGILWLFSLTDVSTGQQSSRRYAGPMRRPITRQIVTQCALPYFPNGEAKIRNRGRMMRFDCAYGFKLVGNRYANCNNGRWDTPVPVCVKSGCATLPLVESGFILYEMNKATAWLSCFDGTELAGSKNTYCNGTHWDRPLGVCRRTGEGTATACDFEAESMCGWTNDVLHDFDWKRSDGTLNPRALRTGPKYDHTKMEPKAGHFMIVDSAEQFTNDTARFISPMFEPELSVGACFQFYYHMYGETVGSLKVYVKPMTSDLYDLKPLFVLEGNQKNVWHEGHIEIAEQEERFQIVFEASLGLRYKSDIAIDDVSLLQGDSCKVAVEDGLDNPEEGPTDPEKVPVKIESCENRCGVSMASVLNNSDTIVHCDCHEDCVINATCCPDFRERCVFEVLSAVNTSANTSTPVIVSTVATTVTTKQVSTTSTAAATTTTVSTTSSTVSTTTKASATTRTTTAKPSTTPRKLPSSTSTTSTTKPYNLRPRPTFVPMTNRPRWTTTTTRKTTVTSTARPTTVSTSTKLPVVATTTTQTVRSSTPSTVVTTTKATSVPTESDMVFEPTEFEATTNGLLAPGFAIAAFPSETVAKPQSLAKFFICAIVGVVVFVGILCITYNYARKSRSSVLARLKEKSQKKCFEDIRFLAGEEDLDFNISQGSEAVEDEKEEGKKGSKNSKQPDAQSKASRPDAEGKRSKKASSGGEKRMGGEGTDSRQDNADVKADYDSENDSSNEDDGHAGGANSTSGRSTKKAYHKYVKYYDEDMASTLL
uniref:Scavenger receptor class C n=1 Tax=Anopheles atroparvus TaxID=41427 RepID=A0AAG5DHM2_ANOAO